MLQMVGRWLRCGAPRFIPRSVHGTAVCNVTETRHYGWSAHNNSHAPTLRNSTAYMHPPKHTYCTNCLKMDTGREKVTSRSMSTHEVPRVEDTGDSCSTSDLTSDSTSDSSSVLDEKPDIFEGLLPEEVTKLQVIQLEYEVFLMDGFVVPSVVTDAQWLTLLYEYPSSGSRREIYKKWHVTEKRRERNKNKRAEQSLIDESRRLASQVPGRDYLNQIICTYMPKATFYQTWMGNSWHTMQHGSPVVVDCSFHELMTDEQQDKVGGLFQKAMVKNIRLREPFHMHFCGAAPSSGIQECVDNIDMPMHLETVSAESVVDLYPREQLVYLTADAPQVMTHYDPEKIYIVGAVPQTVKEQHTLSAASKHGLPALRLPLDEHIEWAHGSKDLHVHHVINILGVLYNGGGWYEALRMLPQSSVRHWRPEKFSDEVMRKHQLINEGKLKTIFEDQGNASNTKTSKSYFRTPKQTRNYKDIFVGVGE